jgi:hypothetical protein
LQGNFTDILNESYTDAAARRAAARHIPKEILRKAAAANSLLGGIGRRQVAPGGLAEQHTRQRRTPSYRERLAEALAP